MEAKHKTAYEAPLAEAFEVKPEGVICGSDSPTNTAGSPTYNGFNDEETW